jgi:hypothetical protein
VSITRHLSSQFRLFFFFGFVIVVRGTFCATDFSPRRFDAEGDGDSERYSTGYICT